MQRLFCKTGSAQRLLTSMIALLCWTLLAGGLVACGTSVEGEEEIGNGSHSPQIVAERFFEDLNLALQDPELIEAETRRVWAERLASHFAPSERPNQRNAFNRTLQTFSYNLPQLAENEQFTVEIMYTTIEVVEQNDELATVRLVDGELRLQKFRFNADNRREILLDQRRPLTDVIGLDSGVFPVLRVNERWFMTERQLSAL
ncbi:MAG: hypothetical protein ACLFVO_20640 [Chloroflexaceae bacterium]